MTLLVDGERVGIWADYMRNPAGALSLTKAELRAAVDAVDLWVDNNAAAFNTAIPQPARGALTAKQKAKLLMMVVEHRFEVS